MHYFNRRIIKKIIIVTSILFSVVVIVLHVAVNNKGKQFLANKLTQIFSRPVTIGKLNTYLFVNVYLEDVTVEGLCHIDKVFAVGGIFDVFRKNLNLALLKVVHPVATIDRDVLESVSAGINPSRKKLETEPQPEQSVVPGVFPTDPQKPARGPMEFTIHQLIISDGVFSYTDKEKLPALTLKKMYVKMGGLQFTSRGLKKFSCQVKGVFPWRQGKEGRLAIDGWVDYPHRNMDVDLALQNIDYHAFAAGYPPFWKPDNLGIREAFLSLVANLNSQHNNLLIDTSLILEDIVFMDDIQDNSKIRYLKTIIAIIQGEQVKPTLSLKINTLMDAPQLDFSQFKNNFKGMIKFRPTMAVEQVVEKTKEVGASAVKGVKEVAVDNAIGAVKGVVGAMRDAIAISEAGKVAEVTAAANATVAESRSQTQNASAERVSP